MLGKIKKYAFKLGFAVMYVVLVAQIVIAIRLFNTPFGFTAMAVIPFTWMAIMISRYCFIRLFQGNRSFGPRPNNNYRR